MTRQHSDGVSRILEEGSVKVRHYKVYETGLLGERTTTYSTVSGYVLQKSLWYPLSVLLCSNRIIIVGRIFRLIAQTQTSQKGHQVHYLPPCFSFSRLRISGGPTKGYNINILTVHNGEKRTVLLVWYARSARFISISANSHHGLRPARESFAKGGRELKRVLRFIFAIHGLMVILINGEAILRGLAVPAPLMGACLDHYWMVLLRKWRMFKKAREKDYKPCISFARSMLWQSVFRSLAILCCCRISVPLSLRRLLFRKILGIVSWSTRKLRWVITNRNLLESSW